MGKRIHSRRGNGRFQKATLENTFGLTTRICPHCNGLNPHKADEPAPEVCGQCGKSLLLATGPRYCGRCGLGLATNQTTQSCPRCFDAMRKDIPICLIGGGADDARTLEDLVSVARIQLDLIAEGQDGTEDDDPEAIKAWLKKWGFES